MMANSNGVNLSFCWLQERYGNTQKGPELSLLLQRGVINSVCHCCIMHCIRMIPQPHAHGCEKLIS